MNCTAKWPRNQRALFPPTRSAGSSYFMSSTPMILCVGSLTKLLRGQVAAMSIPNQEAPAVFKACQLEPSPPSPTGRHFLALQYPNMDWPARTERDVKIGIRASQRKVFPDQLSCGRGIALTATRNLLRGGSDFELLQCSPGIMCLSCGRFGGPGPQQKSWSQVRTMSTVASSADLGWADQARLASQCLVPSGLLFKSLDASDCQLSVPSGKL